jgi:flagellar hook-basal body complex protein FliE
MDFRVPGGLNKSFDGPAIFKALQDVKAEISDISNRVQAKTVDVNSALQRASASLNAVVELINRLFGTLGKVLG